MTLFEPKRVRAAATALALAASMILAACSSHGASSSSVLPAAGARQPANPDLKNVAPIYGGGSTLASLLYRQWEDYYGVAMPPDPQGAPNGLPINPSFQYYYAGIGSGGGRQAFISQTPSTLTPSNPPVFCPNNDNCYPYPLWHYSGSDATLSSMEIGCYQVGCPPTYPNPAQPERGQYVQIPTLSTDITFFYNPTGQTISPTKGLRLSRSTYCGIWEGAITNWGDPAITSDNGGVQVSTQPIVRVVRADSSGTTFLTTNHLNTACQNLSNPAFDWTGGVGGTVTWPGGPVQSGTGSNGVVGVVQSTSGAVGYVGPSFVAPIFPGGLPTASLQNNHNVFGNAKVFTAPTVKTTLNAFVGVTPPSNPDPFDLALLLPDPTEKGAYPIVGFTWLLAYECYDKTKEATAMRGLINWYAQSGTTGTTPPDVILEQQGLAPLNSQWKKSVRGISKNIVAGPVSGVCTI